LLDRLEFIAPRYVRLFKPRLDTRAADASGPKVSSRANKSSPAIEVGSAREIPALVSDQHHVVGIDEVQFFDDGIVPVVNELIDRGALVVAAGLETDFLGEPFDQVARLMALSDHLERFYAKCVCCGAKATRNQRLLNGAPAPRDAPRIQVGGDELYEARCRTCHVVPPAESAPASVMLIGG
jgi:thymidine kinase